MEAQKKIKDTKIMVTINEKISATFCYNLYPPFLKKKEQDKNKTNIDV